MGFFDNLFNRGHADQFARATENATEKEKIAQAISFATQEIMQSITILTGSLRLINESDKRDRVLPILRDACSKSQAKISGFNTAIARLLTNEEVISDPNLQTQLAQTQNKLSELESLISQAETYLS